MIKLKGGDDKNSILAQTAKRMNMPTLNAKGGNNNNNQSFTSPGSHHAQQISSSSSNSSAIPSGPTPVAERLGMPSAIKHMMEKKDKHNNNNKDWSDKKNRINMGAPVFIQGKSTQRQDDDEEPQADDRVKQKLGDVDIDDTDNTNDDEYDSILEEGDDVEEQRLLSTLRAKRLAELKASNDKQQQWFSLGHGSYNEIDQDSFLKQVCNSKYVICHLDHSSFDRCKIVDHHLEYLAKVHLPTKFLKINAEKSPFFVEKLQVKILPTIVMFKDGVAIDRIVGFEELGGNDDFKTVVLEKRLAKAGVLLSKESNDGPVANKGPIRSGNLGRNMQEEEDLDSDEDK